MVAKNKTKVRKSKHNNKTNALTDGRHCQVAAMWWYEIAKVLTRPWRGGAPGLSRHPPPMGTNYWKVLWEVDSTCLMKVNRNYVLGSHNERHMRSKCNVLVRDCQSAHTPLAWWRPWFIAFPPCHGANYWKVLWGVDSILFMKVNKSNILQSHNERTMQNKCKCFFFLYSLVE